MHVLPKLLADQMTWLLVPVLVLSGLRGPLCWCDHSHGSEVVQEECDDDLPQSCPAVNKAESSHTGQPGPHDEQGEHAHTDHQCDSSESCQCVELQTSAHRVEEAAKPEFRKVVVSGPVKEPRVRAALMQPPGAAFRGRLPNARRGHSPPLFVMNCRFLC